MRYAIVSDIHANHQAWKAVWLDIRSIGVDKIICLGDSIGYGPDPGEVLESLYQSVDYFVLGNHEAALCGKIDENSFNDDARDMIAWTRAQVSSTAVRFLMEHPLSLAWPDFRCAHAEFSDAGRFCYAFEPQDAVPSWNAVPEPLLFVGHTHRPCIMLLGGSGIPRMVQPEDFVLEKGKRFLVNVGSVGQPRDGGIRASYCLFDARQGAVYWRHIPFDLDAFRAAHERMGIAVANDSFLGRDPRTGHLPLREQVPFKPPSKPVRDTLDVQYVDSLRKKVRAWKTLFLTGIAIAFGAAAIAAGMWIREKGRSLHIPAAEMFTVRAADFAPESNLLSFPDNPLPPGTPMPNWDVRLGDRYGQEAEWARLEDGRHGFILSSANPDAELRLSSAPVHVAPGMRMCLQGYVKGDDDFRGNIAFALVLVRQRDTRRISGETAPISFETNPNFAVKEPTLRRREGWSLAQQTVTLPARSHAVIFEVRGNFKGTVQIPAPRLELR